MLRELSDELRVLRLDSPFRLAPVLARVQTWLEVDSLLVYSTRNRVGRWEVERFEALGRVASTEGALRAMFARAEAFPLHYDPSAPVSEHRNRLVDPLGWIDARDPGAWERNPLYQDVLYPSGLHRWHQARALICDGPSLVAWFGTVVERPLDPWQHRMLRALVEPVRDRLVGERLLQRESSVQATLEVTLEALGRPAFLVAVDGRILHANRAGQDALDRRGTSLATAIRNAVGGRAGPDDIEVREVAGRGAPVLAILRPGTDGLLEACVEHCAQRWSLTARQRQVLELVTRGLGNATIAATLGCVERTVELHVSAVLDRAGVDSRSALVSRVLTSL